MCSTLCVSILALLGVAVVGFLLLLLFANWIEPYYYHRERDDNEYY